MSTAPREGVSAAETLANPQPKHSGSETEGRKLTLFPWTPVVQTVSLEAGPTCLALQMQTTSVREVSGCAQGHRPGRYRSQPHSGLPETEACIPSSTRHSPAPSQELLQQRAGW